MKQTLQCPAVAHDHNSTAYVKKKLSNCHNSTYGPSSGSHSNVKQGSLEDDSVSSSRWFHFLLLTSPFLSISPLGSGSFFSEFTHLNLVAIKVDDVPIKTICFPGREQASVVMLLFTHSYHGTRARFQSMSAHLKEHLQARANENFLCVSVHVRRGTWLGKTTN